MRCDHSVCGAPASGRQAPFCDHSNPKIVFFLGNSLWIGPSSLCGLRAVTYRCAPIQGVKNFMGADL